VSEEHSTNGEAWSEVGEQFRALGETIAQALRATWEREETRQHARDLQTGLEGLVTNVEQAISDFGVSSEGQRLRAEARKAAGSARFAGEKAWEDAQPHILSALRQVNAELRKVAGRLDGAEEGDTAASTETD
jgi:hypothetical protein